MFNNYIGPDDTSKRQLFGGDRIGGDGDDLRVCIELYRDADQHHQPLTAAEGSALEKVDSPI